MKLKIKNFQAIKSEEIEFTPGVTLITGPTDNGKTAIFRALQSFLTNSADSAGFINGDAIRDKGESAELCVTLEEEGLPKIEFHRDKSKAWYIIDGKKYSKLARTNIFDIYPEMHKKFVYEPEDPRKILNFQTENNLAFPFDRSDTEMFKLFERIFNITDTRAAIDTMKKEEESVMFDINCNLATKNSYTEESQKIAEGLKSVNEDLIENYIEQYKFCANKFQRLKSQLTKIASYAPAIKSVKNLPEMSCFDDATASRVSELNKKVHDCSTKLQYIQKFQNPNFSKVDSSIEQRVLDLKAKISQITGLHSSIENLQKEENRFNEEIRESEKLLAKFETCPLCGHKLED